MNKPIFIAEIKQKSMFNFELRYSRKTLIDNALEFGDWISVHTDPRFGGSFDDIYYLRKETNKPILAKGFHTHDDDVKKAFDLGADYVLVVDRPSRKLLNSYLGNILFEISSLNELNELPHDFLQFGKIVYNGRDLKTGIGKKYIGDYTEYRKKSSWLCGASLIRSVKDVGVFYPDCDAFIVGENLVEFCQEKKLNELLEKEKHER